MEPRGVTLCLLHSALKWPQRLDQILYCVPAPASPDPVYAAIWRGIMGVRRLGGNPDPAHFREQVLAAVQLETPAYSSNASQFIRYVGSSRVPSEQHCMDLLKQEARKRLFENMPDLDSPGADTQLIQKIERINKLTDTGAPDHLDIFADRGRTYLRPNPMTKTGFFLIDNMFGGLFPVGRMVLYVIPSKSGKTLFSLQLSKFMIEQGMSVMYMNFEQMMEGDLATRVYMMASDSSKQEWENIRCFDDLPEPILAKLDQNIPNWNTKFFGYAAENFEDPQALNHGADSIKETLQTKFLDRGIKVPDIIIIDWWKELWERCQASMQASGKMWSPQEARAKEFLHFKKLKLMAQILGTRILVFMQIKAALQASSASLNIDKMSSFDAAENHALPNYADAAVVATKLAKDESVTFKLDICRFSKPGGIIRAKMDGDNQLFIPFNSTDNAKSVDADDAAIAEGGFSQ
jgi:hypothetical protein